MTYSGPLSAWLDKIRGSIKGLSVSGTTITATKNDNTTLTITTQDTTYNTATSDVDGLMSASDKTAFDVLETLLASGTTGQVFTKTEDGYGWVDNTCINGLSVDGQTVTYSKANGTTGTIITQDTNTTYSEATQSASGLMSTDDKKLVDSIPDLGTFNQMFFSQTSGNYIAPRTGIYRITIKGGGGGGAGACTPDYICGGQGGEGGTMTFYKTLTKGSSYAYTIGAGGSYGANSTTSGTNGGAGSDGGNTSFNNEYTAPGGQGAPVGALRGGNGGSTFTTPSGATVYKTYGMEGVPASRGDGFWATGQPGNGAAAALGRGGKGGGGSGSNKNPGTGGNGFILIEYAG